LPWLKSQRQLTEKQDFKVVSSIPRCARNFYIQDCKKIQQGTLNQGDYGNYVSMAGQVMGPGQNFLTLVRSFFFCSSWVRSTTSGFWKFHIKNTKFFNFFPKKYQQAKFKNQGSWLTWRSSSQALEPSPSHPQPDALATCQGKCLWIFNAQSTSGYYWCQRATIGGNMWNNNGSLFWWYLK